MRHFTLPSDVVDSAILEKTVSYLKAAKIRLPTFGELAEPAMNLTRNTPDDTDINAPNVENLNRIHWYNAPNEGGLVDVPDHFILTKEVTGVDAPIIVMNGGNFPMIGAHKVLPAYACLVVRLISGQFDPNYHRAIWPSTGNYCRGGVAISKILGCRGVAVLPEGMSQERFDWLEDWVGDPADIIRTPGSESNVKEIYDKCAELSAEPSNAILNQFSEFANYLVHYKVTGTAIDHVFSVVKGDSDLSLAAFVAGTGSSGTLASGDYLKKLHGTKIVAMEARECPTMLLNGYGEHNIQGIGDKHIPLIHNVMNTDFAVGIGHESCDHLSVLFNTKVGQKYLNKRWGFPKQSIKALSRLGHSGIGNLLASIKTARYLGLGKDQAVVTIATDSGALYKSERESTEIDDFPHGFDMIAAGEVYAQHLRAVSCDYIQELSHQDRCRIFNLGYFTWVEQQGVSLEDFDARRHQSFWNGLTEGIPRLDELITEFNCKTGMP